MKCWLVRSACAMLAASVAFAVPYAQQPQDGPAFEVAVLRPSMLGPSFSPPFGLNRWSHASIKLYGLLSISFDVEDIVGLPDWTRDAVYSISVKAEDGVLLMRDALRPRMRRFVDERFKLVTHIETRKVKGFALVVARGGPKLKTATEPEGTPDRDVMTAMRNTSLRSASLRMYFLARHIGSLLGEPVVDETGLNEWYDVTLTFSPAGLVQHFPDATLADSPLPSLFTALQEQLGLRLIDRDGIPVDTLVIDHVEHPTVD